MHVISHFALLVSEAQIPGNMLPPVMEELVQWGFKFVKAENRNRLQINSLLAVTVEMKLVN